MDNFTKYHGWLVAMIDSNWGEGVSSNFNMEVLSTLGQTARHRDRVRFLRRLILGPTVISNRLKNRWLSFLIFLRSLFG